MFTSCSSQSTSEVNVDSSPKKVLPGAYDTEAYIDLLKDKNLALVVNQTSEISGVHLVDSLIARSCKISKVFAPEHGFRGDADAGAQIEDNVDPSTGIPVFSLYGRKKKPDPSDLEGIDLIVFDIQDVGVRFYTYLSTLHYIIEAAGENNIPLLVLDRPNPNIRFKEGPVLKEAYSSFVGLHPVPVFTGMTIGEYALMINGEGWTEAQSACELQVVPCQNYARDSLYVLPVKPSPNLPNQNSIYLYASLCFFEPTSISVGRGTNAPFQHIGHPLFEGMNHSFTPVSREGATSPKHKDEVCYGEWLSEIGDKPLGLDLSYLFRYYNLCKEKGIEFMTNERFFDLLAGSSLIRDALLEGSTSKDLELKWRYELDAYKAMSEKYHLYAY